MTRLMIAAALVLSTAHAYADRYTYVCKANGKRSAVKIDDKAHTFKWAGKTYTLKDAKGGGDDCPRLSWDVKGNGKSFNFCTATKGVADFAIDGRDIECGQKS